MCVNEICFLVCDNRAKAKEGVKGGVYCRMTCQRGR